MCIRLHIDHRHHELTINLLRSTHVVPLQDMINSPVSVSTSIFSHSYFKARGAYICFSKFKVNSRTYAHIHTTTTTIHIYAHSTHLSKPKRKKICTWIKKLVLKDWTKWKSRYNAYLYTHYVKRKRRQRRKSKKGKRNK